MKAYIRLLVILGAVMTSASLAMGAAQTRPSHTLLIVPAKHTPVQISMDVLSRRPASVVAYQTNAHGELQLNVWERSRWVLIDIKDLEDLSFMRTKPSQIVLVGDQDATADIRAAIAHHDTVKFAENVLTTPLLNELGRILNFSNREWHWFAKRYGGEINVLNEEDLRGSWYDQSREEFLERERSQRGRHELPRAEVVDE